MSLHEDAIDILRRTSRTFYVCIIRLPSGLREAVMCAYLCLRAIDEIEDHPHIGKITKIKLLRSIGFSYPTQEVLRTGDTAAELSVSLHKLPEVTCRMGEWMRLAPESIAPRIWDANTVMAQRMAFWVANNWSIQTEADLDGYTYSVAGAVGLLLADLWSWYDGTSTHRGNAVGFGRGLQAVNILRNRTEDLSRGVDLFPHGWKERDIRNYAERNLSLGDAYVESLSPGPIREFCRIPLVLAYATLIALAQGKTKLSREEVIKLTG